MLVSNYFNITENQVFITTSAIAVTVEVGLFLHRSWTHREEVKEKLYECIAFVKNQPLKTVAYLVAAVVIGVGVFYGAALVLPTSFAIMCALSAIYTVGNAYQKRNEIWQKAVTCFTPMKGENPEIARKRIQMNILKTVTAVVFVTAISVTLFYLIHTGAWIAILEKTQFGRDILSEITKAQNGQWWNFPLSMRQFIDQTWFVITSYSLVGIAHLYKVHECVKKKEKAKALLHLLGGILGFGAIYAMVGGFTSLRFHHAFYGLLFMFAPVNLLRYFGLAVTLDSSLYWFNRPLAPNWDFTNVFQDNLVPYLTILWSSLLLRSFTTFEDKSASTTSKDSNTSTTPLLEPTALQKV